MHVRGAFFSNIRGIAVCVMAAALRGCALVEEDITARPAMADFVTSPAMRQRCHAAKRSLAFHCYFLPLSSCTRSLAGVSHKEKLPNMYDVDGEMSQTDTMLAMVENTTGLSSELLILSAATSWVMRPQPEVAEAVTLFGGAAAGGASSSSSGTRPRIVGVHMRSDEKLGVRSLGADRWRASPSSFQAWGQRIARIVGADKVCGL